MITSLATSVALIVASTLIARAVLPAHGRAGWDYVLVGRPGATATRDFAALMEDLRRALGQIHGSGR